MSDSGNVSLTAGAQTEKARLSERRNLSGGVGTSHTSCE